MRRRDLLPLLAALAAAAARAAGAQQPPMPVVGFLGASDPQRDAPFMDAWRKALADAGFVEGRSLAVEYRMVETGPGRFPVLAADLVARRVDAIMTTSGNAARAAMEATTTIPIVFTGAEDPVRGGLVQSLNRPGGNVTGIVGSFDGLTEKRLQLLHELVPDANRIGYLVDQENSRRERLAAEVERLTAAARTRGAEVILLTASNPEEIEPAIAAGKRMGIGAVVVQLHPFMYAQQKRIIESLARHALPGARWGDFAAQGGLLSYGPDFADIAYQGGAYVARILNGAKPAELPVAQPTKFTLVINLKTAKALGLTVPPTMLALADELVE